MGHHMVSMTAVFFCDKIALRDVVHICIYNSHINFDGHLAMLAPYNCVD